MSDLFERARSACKVETLAAKLVKLSGAGDELRGACPICHAGDKSKSRPFKIDVGGQKWRCFTCERHGDVVDLYAEAERVTLVEAAQSLAGPDGVSKVEAKPAPETPIAGDDDRAKRIALMAADMISGSRPIVGTLGARYFLNRGIAPEIVDRLDGPRFHEAAPHSWNPDARVWRKAPAIVSRVVTPGGWAGGVHVTYLAEDGSGKAALDPAKRMWGPQGEETGPDLKGRIGRRRGGAWLIGSFGDDAPLIVGEGKESALSLATWLWRKRGLRDFGVAAALSLGGLQGVAWRDGDGCVNLSAPEPDPASPAFTWPPCNTAGAKPFVILAIDRDMSPVRLKAKNGRGRVLDYELDAEARARLCAKLAASAWRAAGWEPFVMYPAPNGDWNDTLRGGLR